MKTRLSLAVMAIAGLTSPVAAESTFSMADHQTTNSFVIFDLVRSDGPGTIEIYDFQRHSQGRLIGQASLHDGVNTNVRVPLSPPPVQRDAMAVLVVNGAPVATQVIEFDR